MLIRLSQTATRCSGPRFRGVELRIGGGGDAAGDAEQGSEGVERIEAAVEAEREFVEIGL